MPPPAGFTYSEDCLVLNLWRPTAAAPARSQTLRGGGGAALMPVLFWIHGGGFTQVHCNSYGSCPLPLQHGWVATARRPPPTIRTPRMVAFGVNADLFLD